MSRYYWQAVKVSNLFVISPDKHSRDSLVMCDAVRPHYPPIRCEQHRTHVWCQSRALFISGVNLFQTKHGGRSCHPGLGTCCRPGPGPNVPQIVFDVGHFDRNRCPVPVSNLGDDTQPESIQHFINETIGSLFHRR